MPKTDATVERRARELFEAEDHKNLTWDLVFTEQRAGTDTIAAIGEEYKRTYLERAKADITKK